MRVVPPASEELGERTGQYLGLAAGALFIIRGPVPVPDVAALTDAQGRFTLSHPAAGS
jgi:hypothetical protein